VTTSFQPPEPDPTATAAGVPPPPLEPPPPPPEPKPAAGQMVSWLVTSVIVGWFVVYNIVRIAGRAPSSAAWISLAIGGILGVAGFLVTLTIWRRRAGEAASLESGRAPESPEAAEARRRAVAAASPVVGALAVVAIVVGIAMAIAWVGDTGGRSLVRILIAGWDILVGAWLLEETAALYRGDAEAVDSIGLAALLTAVMAGVALSRDTISIGQIVLIAVSGAAGAVAYYAAWRLAGSRGVPIAAAGTVVAAVLALVIPLAS